MRIRMKDKRLNKPGGICGGQEKRGSKLPKDCKKCWCPWRLALLVAVLALASPFILRVIGMFQHDGISTIFSAPSPVRKNDEYPPSPVHHPVKVSPIMSNENWDHLDPERSIALIHVGKSGGMTIRHSTGLTCRLGNNLDKTEAERQPCIDAKFGPQETLARQVKYYFHMYLRRPAELKQATAFLFVLRNPVDRIISTFKYSHPQNCNEKTTRKRGDPDPWGCHLVESVQEEGSTNHRIYNTCFPVAEMELFAQSTMTPFPPDSEYTFQNTKMNKEDQISDCRSFANRLVLGSKPEKQVSPHMFYNYDYYMNATVRTYPDKEIFVIRTEYEWEDMKALNVAIGGKGESIRPPKLISHSSEHYVASPLSSQAYEKLCCVLHDEIEVYQDLLIKAVNLNATAKADAMNSLTNKCGIKASLEAWLQECHLHSQRDEPYFKKARLAGPNAVRRPNSPGTWKRGSKKSPLGKFLQGAIASRQNQTEAPAIDAD